MCPIGQILPQHFEMSAVTKVFERRDNLFAPLLSTGKYKTFQTHAHSMDDGDCDAVIAAAAAAVTHIQTLSQEVGPGDEGLGLLCGFD